MPVSKTLTAYISETRDREKNIFFRASICDENEDAIISELSDYDRDSLIVEVLKQYPDVNLEND